MTQAQSMPDYPDAELLAYLDGYPNLALEKALLQSPILQARLQQLNHTYQMLTKQLGQLDTANTLDLADVATDMASANQRLTVAAQIRQHPQLKTEMSEMSHMWQRVTKQPKKSPGTFKLPIFLALPLLASADVRSEETSFTPSQHQSFYVSELTAQINFRIIAPFKDQWGIKGFITIGHESQPAIEIGLCLPNKRIKKQTTDSNGGFTFNKLAEGEYILRATFANGRIVTPPFTLSHD